MDPLPKLADKTGKSIEQYICEYNEEVRSLFVAMMQCGNEKASLSGETFGLTGVPESQFDPLAGDIVHPIGSDLVLDQSLIPSIPYPLMDHRRRKVARLLSVFSF